MKSSLFITNFTKGQAENPNIGLGSIVGFDVYSKKGVAMLAKKTSIMYSATGDTSPAPHFFASSQLNLSWWAQMSNGDVLYSQNDGATGPIGTTWKDTSFPTGATGGCNGNGMIYFQNYMFAFTNTKIYYHSSDPTATAGWTDWTTAKGLDLLQALTTSPINDSHFPLLYPSARGVYFVQGSDSTGGNAAASVGFFGQNGTLPFDPSGTTGTNFLYNGAAFNLPALTYTVNTLSFLAPTKLSMGALAFQTPEAADLITWDTVSANKFDPPLRLFSNSYNASGANIQENDLTGGIKQLIARNQVLYAVVGGNHTIYETNGSTFNLVNDIALYSSVRGSSGAETNYPVFFNSYPQAICVMGNKLFTGVATTTNNSSYPPSTNKIYPIGVWSIAFNPDGSKSTQCEYVVPVGPSPYGPTGSGNYSKITSVFPVGNGKLLIGYDVKAPVSFIAPQTKESGIALTNTFTYVSSRAQTALESELFEIGTALNPQTVNNIELLLVRKLASGHVVDISYRTSLDQDWTVLDTFSGDGTKDSYKITKNPIGATRYLQLRLRAEAGSPNTDSSPEIRNVVIS